MPEKKTVLAVILGVSFVSLVAALIAGLADGISILTDFTKLYGKGDFRYDIGVALLELAVIVLGIVLVAMFLLCKKNRKKVLICTCIALFVLSVVSIIILKAIMPTYDTSYVKGHYYTDYYALFTGFMATAITVMVSSVLMTISYMLLLRQQNVEPANSVQTENEQKEQPTSFDDTISAN